MGNIHGKAGQGCESERGNTHRPIFTVSQSPTQDRPKLADSNFYRDQDATPEGGQLYFQRNAEIKSVLSSTGKSVMEMTSSANDEARFIVGDERIMVIGQKSKMAASSEVFDAMLNGPWGNSDAVIEIPDVSPEALTRLIGYADGENTVMLTEDNVWDVLKAADKYQVVPVVHQCFSFLLHVHPARGEGQHICEVMELAHLLHQPEYQEACLDLAKIKACEVLRSDACLSQLCYDCMLALVQSDDLAGVDETLVHEAVIMWSRYACARQGALPPTKKSESPERVEDGIIEVGRKGSGGGCCNYAYEEGERREGSLHVEGEGKRRKGSSESCRGGEDKLHTATGRRNRSQTVKDDRVSPPEPSWEELRYAARDLVYHVRYLSMPRPALLQLLSAKSSNGPPCLLTKQEKIALLTRNGSGFPDEIRYRRWTRVVSTEGKTSSSCVKVVIEVCVYVLVILLLVHLLLFML
ncbi:uncharacterized protein [Littorina saxatilis]|uniref:BTB domain-containing protein n=1 Tax=Littorina saxatilis TaxID=31220 RepID=A0AAN9BUY7_9CAEN